MQKIQNLVYGRPWVQGSINHFKVSLSAVRLFLISHIRSLSAQHGFQVVSPLRLKRRRCWLGSYWTRGLPWWSLSREVLGRHYYYYHHLNSFAFWLSVTFFGSLSLTLSDYLWLSLALPGSILLSLALSGSLWPLLVLSVYHWLPLAFSC